MIQIESFEALVKYIGTENKKIKVYGAGEIAFKFVAILKEIRGGDELIECFMVSSLEHDDTFLGKTVVSYSPNIVRANEIIVLALGRKNAQEVLPHLCDKNIQIVIIDPQVYWCEQSNHILYRDCLKDIQDTLSKDWTINQTIISRKDERKYAWTCWWQGENNAPDIVKACINSQRINLPAEVEHIVITQNNFTEYLDIPDYIMQGIQNGNITLTTFSDILREMLLFQYGGIWFDSTVLIHKEFPIEYFELPLYTCKGQDYHFCSYSQFSLWCMGGLSHNMFYKFLYESFFEYYSCNSKIKYYLTVDYYISAALQFLKGTKEQYDLIPINNEMADRLAPHLKDRYSKELYKEMTRHTTISKLTYKHFSGRNGEDFQGFSNESVYQYIIDKYS